MWGMYASVTPSIGGLVSKLRRGSKSWHDSPHGRDDGHCIQRHELARVPGTGVVYASPTNDSQGRVRRWDTARAMGIAVTLVLGACGQAPSPVHFSNGTEYPTGFAVAIVNRTNAVVEDQIDLSGYRIHMEPESGGGCAAPDAAACTNVEDKDIHSPFIAIETVQNAFIRQASLNREAAGILCHELGHVYYYQTTGDADGDHKHMSAWFDFYTAGSVCFSIAEAFDDNDASNPDNFQ